MKHLITGALAALLASTAAGVMAQDATYTLRATANRNENDEDYDGLVVFKNYVEAASNGQIAVEMFIGTQLCSTGEECLEGVAEGSIDIYIATSGGTASLFPFVQVLDLPYLMSDDRVAEAVLDNGSPFVATMRQMVRDASDDQIRLMTIGNTGGWRNVANVTKPVQTPADLQGLKIRTVPAELPQVLAEAWGAAPTAIPWPELFTSIRMVTGREAMETSAMISTRGASPGLSISRDRTSTVGTTASTSRSSPARARSVSFTESSVFIITLK